MKTEKLKTWCNFVWNYLLNRKESFIMMVVMFGCVFVQDYLCERVLGSVWFHPCWACLFLSSFVLLFKRRWPSWLIVFLFSLWCMTLIIYFRANDLILDFNAIMMVDNMDGFWTAVLAYVDWTIWVLLLIPVLYGLFLFFMPRIRKRCWTEWCLIMFACAFSAIWTAYETFPTEEFNQTKSSIDFYLDNGESDTPWSLDNKFGRYGEKWFIPYHFGYFSAQVHSSMYLLWFFRNHGPIHYLPASFVYYLGSHHAENIAPDADELGKYWHPDQPMPESPQYNVVCVLLESMESWPIEIEPYNEHLVPNMCQLTHTNHVLFVPHIYSQVRHGVSADGQMLLNTGLLPIQSGATCLLYPDNYFPNFASLYPYSVTIDPCSSNTWNQAQMTSAYGYKNYMHSETYWSDKEVIEQLIHVLDTIHEPFCVQAITSQTHTPFALGKDFETNMPDGMPVYMHDYLGCIHHLDEYIGWMMDTIQHVVDMHNTVIVFTADHSIFKSKLLESFNKYAQANDIRLPKERSYCPLFIYAPHIDNQIIDGDFYQMDIYPTLLALLGLENHPWKGLGINVLDSVARVERSNVDESSYYQLSNSIIINNSLNLK